MKPQLEVVSTVDADTLEIRVMTAYKLIQQLQANPEVLLAGYCIALLLFRSSATEIEIEPGGILILDQNGNPTANLNWPLICFDSKRLLFYRGWPPFLGFNKPPYALLIQCWRPTTCFDRHLHSFDDATFPFTAFVTLCFIL